MEESEQRNNISYCTTKTSLALKLSKERERYAEKGLSLQSLCVCPGDLWGVVSV